MTEFTGDPAERSGQPEYGAPPVPPAVPPPGSGYPPAQGDYAAPPAGYAQTPPDPAAAGYAPTPAAAGSGRGYGGFDPKNLQGFDPKSVNPLDWGIIAAGVVAFIFSLFAFYSYSVSISIAGFSTGKRTAHWSAWHGFFGWFAVLLVLVAAILLAAELIARMTLPFPVRTVVLGLFVIALICLLLALFVIPGNTGGASAFGVNVDKGHGFGYWITLIAVIAGTALAYKRFADTGGKLPRRSAA